MVFLAVAKQLQVHYAMQYGMATDGRDGKDSEVNNFIEHF